FRRQQVRPLPDQRGAAGWRTQNVELTSGAPTRAGHFASGGPVGCGDDGAGPSPQASAWERGLTTIYPYSGDPCIIWNGYAWNNIWWRAERLRPPAARAGATTARRRLACLPFLGRGAQRLNRKERSRD